MTAHNNQHRVLLLDLDDTLHNASKRIMPLINTGMARYLSGKLKLSLAEARSLAKRYYLEHGATVRGLISHHHSIDYLDFLHQTHSGQDIYEQVEATPGLLGFIQAIPIPIYVISNGPQQYVQLLVEKLGIERYISRSYSIEDMDFHPKPSHLGFLSVLQKDNLNPGECLFVDDLPQNVAAATKLGMNSLWFNPEHRTHQEPLPVKHTEAATSEQPLKQVDTLDSILKHL